MKQLVKITAVAVMAAVLAAALPVMAQDQQASKCYVASSEKLLGFIPWERNCDVAVQKKPGSAEEMEKTAVGLLTKEDVRSCINTSAETLLVACEKEGKRSQLILWLRVPAGSVVFDQVWLGNIQADAASIINTELMK